MSYYKSIMTGKNKKKVIKEQPKPKKTVLDGIKQELNEWTSKPPTEKRWSKNTFDSGLTEFEERGGKDFIKEVGAAPEYKKHMQRLEKLYDEYGAAVGDFETLLKKKGLKKEAKTLSKLYGNYVYKFYMLTRNMIRRLL